MLEIWKVDATFKPQYGFKSGISDLLNLQHPNH